MDIIIYLKEKKDSDYMIKEYIDIYQISSITRKIIHLYTDKGYEIALDFSKFYDVLISVKW